MTILSRKSPTVGATGRYQAIDTKSHNDSCAHWQADETTLRAVVQHFGGEVRGNSACFPTPGHSACDRGCVATLKQGAPDGLLVHSFNGGDPLAIKAELRTANILPEWRARGVGSHGARWALTLMRNIAPVPLRAPQSTGERHKQEREIELWQEAQAPAGTLVTRYLAREGIPMLPDDADRFLRFHPSCPFGRETLPAMLVLVHSIATGKPQAIERTALTADGMRAGRMTLGPKTGGVVMVSADEEVEAYLALCEGVKDALALLQAGFWWPMWATLGTSGMKNFPLLDGIEALCIYADNDPVGRKAAATLWSRYRQGGRHVEVIWPEQEGSDPADILSAREVSA